MILTGRFIRIERWWHRAVSVEHITGDVDGRARITTACRFVLLAAPSSLMRGLPGAGAVVCGTCAQWKEKTE